MTPFNRINWLFLFALLLLVPVSEVCAERGRPVVAKKDGLYQLQTTDGRPIRGTMFNLYNSPNNASDLTSKPWSTYWSHWHVSSTRVWVRRMTSGGVLKTGTYESVPEPELERRLDYIVEQCARYNMYAIVDYHDVTGNTGNASSTSSDAYKFWNKYAPRYKDRTHVIYEIYNEPTYGYSLSGTALEKIVALYKHVRSLAPRTHLIVFSLGKYSYESTVVGTADKAQGIDWSNASIGFHTYALSTGVSGVDAIKKGRARYPMIMTESGGQSEAWIKLYETAGVAWTGLGYLGKSGYESWVIWDGGYGSNGATALVTANATTTHPMGITPRVPFQLRGAQRGLSGGRVAYLLTGAKLDRTVPARMTSLRVTSR